MKKINKCCGAKESSGATKGILYGIIPHIGCILFIVASILGSTILMQFFKPLLMNKNLFYYMVLISVGFATLSSLIYLKKNKCLSLEGIKRKKGYLAIMYGSTIGVNILLFLFIFPALVNLGNNQIDISGKDLTLLKLSVAIPCSGHASLISNELKTIDGVTKVEYSQPNEFDVYYSPNASETQILSLDIFKEFTAKIIRK